MDVVVDANIIFSILIKKGFNNKILVEKDINMYSPTFLREEILEHYTEIVSKTHRTYEEFLDVLDELMDSITFVEIDACEIECSDVDDAPYIALALQLNIPIWSEDKDLKKSVTVKVYNTKELSVQ